MALSLGLWQQSVCPASVRQGSGGYSHSPPHNAALQVVDLDKLAEAARVVVVGCLGVPEGLWGQGKVQMGVGTVPGPQGHPEPRCLPALSQP